jgi:hypothetical protein
VRGAGAGEGEAEGEGEGEGEGAGEGVDHLALREVRERARRRAPGEGQQERAVLSGLTEA